VGVLAAVFPGICTLCRRRSHRAIDLCRDCEAAFEINKYPCPSCGEPSPLGPAGGGAICGSCLVSPPPWSRTVAPFIYSPPLGTLIEGLKSGNGLRQARALGNLLRSRVRERYADEPLPDALIAVPLTPKRQRNRGFNQAEFLAGAIGRELGLPQIRGRLVRVRDAPPQRSLPRSARMRNVRRAFAVRSKRRGRALPARLALVDDVTTTGATVRSATEALLAAGVEEVDVWVAAKTPTRPGA